MYEITLQAPLFIGSALAPAIQVGDTTLSLLSVSQDGQRQKAEMELYGPDMQYIDHTLRSGVGGFRSVEEPFEAFLAFLGAAAEATIYGGSENAKLFPHHVMQWCHAHADAISEARMSLDKESENENL
jgi:hypothetical protein